MHFTYTTQRFKAYNVCSFNSSVGIVVCSKGKCNGNAFNQAWLAKPKYLPN